MKYHQIKLFLYILEDTLQLEEVQEQPLHVF